MRGAALGTAPRFGYLPFFGAGQAQVVGTGQDRQGYAEDQRKRGS